MHPAAKNLVIGQRIPPQVLLYAAHFRPVDIQDLCPSDTRFKIFIFAGDLTEEERTKSLEHVGQILMGPEGLNARFGGGRVIEVLTVLSGKKEAVDYMTVRLCLRSSWRKYVEHDLLIFLVVYFFDMLTSYAHTPGFSSTISTPRTFQEEKCTLAME